MKKYIDSFVNYRFLLSELVKKGIKLKYRRSYLGIIWSLLEPLCTMIVLTVVFGTILGNRTKEFSVYILCGRLLFSFLLYSYKGSAYVYSKECFYDQKSICSQISLYIIKHFVQLHYFLDFFDRAGCSCGCS